MINEDKSGKVIDDQRQNKHSRAERDPTRRARDTAVPPIERIASLFARGNHGYASLPTSAGASLRRLDINRPARSMNAVISALVTAELPVEAMNDDELLRWASIIHVVALLAGTAGKSVHRSSRAAGKSIAAAEYSNARFARLLTAQGAALPPQVVRLARFLATKQVALPLDLRPIAELLLWDGRDTPRADSARMTLARAYYTGSAVKSTVE